MHRDQLLQRTLELYPQSVGDTNLGQYVQAASPTPLHTYAVSRILYQNISDYFPICSTIKATDLDYVSE